MVKTAAWLKELRGTIKRTYGPGWVLEERSSCFTIQRRDAGNAKLTASLTKRQQQMQQQQ